MCPQIPSSEKSFRLQIIRPRLLGCPVRCLLFTPTKLIHFLSRLLSSAEYFKEVKFPTLKLEAAHFSETSVNFYHTTHIVRQYKRILHTFRRQNNKGSVSEILTALPSYQSARPHTTKYNNLQIIILKFSVVLIAFQSTYIR